MNYPWSKKQTKPPEAAETVADLLKCLEPHAAAHGDDLFTFMVRAHITDGAIDENLSCLKPKTVARLRRFLASAPKPEADPDPDKLPYTATRGIPIV